MSESQLVTAVDICAELRISEKVLAKLIEAGQFPPPMRLGRKRVWLRKVLNIEQAEQPKETEEHA